MILAGDLGGTKANLGAYEMRGGKLRCVAKERFASHEYARAEDVIQAFARTFDGKVTAACFDVAGPVVDNTVRATNLPWFIDGASLARMLKLDHVPLLNDLEATGYGLRVLEPADLETLQAGIPAPRANQALIAAGTGLGEAVLYWTGDRHVPMATEGGHTDFAPPNQMADNLVRYLRKKYSQIECESLISGRGFREIHDFLDSSLKHPGFDDPAVDPAAEITRRAIDGSCLVCVQAVELWVEIYGAEAGNLALRSLARGGVYVAGGIAVKILPMLKGGRFVEAFNAKIKFRDFLSRVPIQVVLNEEAPLLGAAHFASLGTK